MPDIRHPTIYCRIFRHYPSISDKECRIIRPEIRQEKTDPAQSYSLLYSLQMFFFRGTLAPLAAFHRNPKYEKSPWTKNWQNRPLSRSPGTLNTTCSVWTPRNWFASPTCWPARTRPAVESTTSRQIWPKNMHNIFVLRDDRKRVKDLSKIRSTKLRERRARKIGFTELIPDHVNWLKN